MGRVRIFLTLSPTKFLLGCSINLVALSMEAISIRGESPRPSYIVSILIHFFGTLCLFGGTFIVTSSYLAVLTNFRLVVCRRTQVDKLILEEFSWWRRRERIVILKKNGKKVTVTEVSGLIGEAGYGVPGKTIGRINLMLRQSSRHGGPLLE